MRLQTHTASRAVPAARAGGRAPLWAAGLAWLAAGAALVWWGLMLLADTPWQPVPAATGTTVQVDPSSVARALGHDDRPDAPGQTVQTSGRLVLAGVVAQPGGQGAALISVNGQPPRPFLVGAAVGDGWVLHAVGRRDARLRSEDGELALEIQR